MVEGQVLGRNSFSNSPAWTASLLTRPGSRPRWRLNGSGLAFTPIRTPRLSVVVQGAGAGMACRVRCGGRRRFRGDGRRARAGCWRRRLDRRAAGPERQRDGDWPGQREAPSLSASHGVVPVTYGDGVPDRIRAASGDGSPRSWIQSALAMSSWRWDLVSSPRELGRRERPGAGRTCRAGRGGPA
jgi:hypothetical protein